MENDTLQKLWKTQHHNLAKDDPSAIILRAKKQRNGQYFSILIMSITVSILVVYAFIYGFKNWNTFNLGLTLMIGSLTFRIMLEFYSLFRKEIHLISMDHNAYHQYLKKYFKIRLLINYIITPICLLTYSIGFVLLLPYFKSYFSTAFYTYLLVSGFLSIIGVIIIVAKSIIKEMVFLKQLNEK
ncbi:hypothetical protein [Polaribacter sp.]|uniref:hypothetical protein n=1 Tax=Polaribacter sp. TaxID=1920175 RepID=UPI0040475E0A